MLNNQILQQTLQLQQKASDPKHSVFVSASAGSGKTKILTDRVLRLLLSGVHPAKILCLTFTKVAAFEMQNRIHKKLEQWVFLEQNKLEEEISNLLGFKPSKIQISNARILFVKTLDANPGLKISTIHSFCEKLIRKFPVEIKINPNFQIIDSQKEYQLLQDSKKELLKTALTDHELAKKIENITSLLNENSFSEIILELINKREKLITLKEQYCDINGVIEKIYKILNCKISDDQETIDQLICEPDFNKQNLLLLCQYMEESDKSTDIKSKEAILNYINCPNKENFEQYKFVFLKQDEGAKALSKIATKKSVLEKFLQAESIITTEQIRILNLVNHINSISIAKSTSNLLFVADRMLNIYIDLKNRNGLLDYNDLISKTAHLLQDSTNSEWIKYKLDGQLEHILIDESQDTNHYQWSIINALTEDFFSGTSSNENNRTIFIVGDEKQSIYSFQGADPEIFGNIYYYYKEKSSFVNQQIQDIALGNSFRSSKAVLEVVDCVFSKTEHGKAISKLKEVKHNAVKDNSFGRVELWPIVNVAQEEEKSEEYEWQFDFTKEAEIESKELLATTIVQTIKKWIDEKRILKSQKRHIKYSDIMILLKNRTNNLGNLLIKHFQEENIPINGKDKIELTKDIVVQDLLAAAKFILNNRDDLNLACLIKSPLINATEEELLELCLNKNKKDISLFLSLKTSKNPKYQKIYNYLIDIINFNKENPNKIYELFFYILEIKEGKKAITERFGHHAQDIINQFLILCLKSEESNIFSLEKFIDSLNNISLEVKIESSNQELNEVKIITIHSAKGLEAPIVFLADSAHCPQNKYGSNNQKIIWCAQNYNNLPIWPAGKNNNLLKEVKNAEQNNKNDEYLRQLYVAMTRAADELYITGFGKNIANDCWYNIVKDSINQNNIDNCKNTIFKINDQLEGEGLIIAKEETETKINIEEQQNITLVKELPSFIKKIDQIKDNTQIIYPSKYLKQNRKFEFNEKSGEGKIIHKILEILPNINNVKTEEKEKLITNYLKKHYKLSDARCLEILKQIFNILNNKKFSHLFDNNSKSEVAVIGKINGKVISGKIDRLVINEKEIIIIDYKTGYKIEDINDEVFTQYRNQLLLYKKLIQKIYHDKKIKCLIILTKEAKIIEIT